MCTIDQINQIIAYEQNELSDEQTIEMFQTLIDNGVVWGLQGSYGRCANMLIGNGTCTPAGHAQAVRQARFEERKRINKPWDK